MTTTETRTEYPADVVKKVMESLEEEISRAECMAKVMGQEQRICALWRNKAETFHQAAELIRRAYL